MANTFRRKKDSTHYLSGYRVENVRSNRPVIVSEQSVIVGDIYAPQVFVAGMVFGYIVSGEVTIDPKGQIWGDICASSVVVMPGSKVHGWISTMDEGTINLLRLDQLWIEEVPRTGEFATTTDASGILAKLVPDIVHEDGLNAQRVEIWRSLQSEAAAAFAARTELEQVFSSHVEETVGALVASGQQVDSSPDDQGPEQFTDGGAPGFLADAELQLRDATSEINKLRAQLATSLKYQEKMRNQLLWTRESLQEVREQQVLGSTIQDSERSSLSKPIRRPHLAKLQATVVERDLLINDLKDKLATREGQLSRIKSLATKRIELLEKELSQIKGQDIN